MPRSDDLYAGFRSWVLARQDELNALHEAEPHDQVWEEAALIAHQAGERAARLGLTAIFQKSRRYGWSITTREAVAFLAECLEGLPEQEPDTLTPPQVARMLGINSDKVLVWIRSGELKASNLAKRPGGRPKYRIAREDVEAFRARRAVQPRPKRKPRPTWRGKTYL